MVRDREEKEKVGRREVEVEWGIKGGKWIIGTNKSGFKEERNKRRKRGTREGEREEGRKEKEKAEGRRS